MSDPARKSSVNGQRNFVHKFIPASRTNARTLLLLHGTGGNENDLISLGRELSRDSALLSPRGRILEAGMPRFFKRFAEGVFDLEDLRFRTNELADFVMEASKEYKFDPDLIVGVGYSNGANIATRMLLLRPEVLKDAILFRAMVPLIPEKLPDLSAKTIFLSEGRFDSIVNATQASDLVELLRKSGAKVHLNWTQSDHSLTQEEIMKARRFLEEEIKA